MIRHHIQPLKFLDITTTAYRTDFERNWYKLDKVRASEGGDKVSISNVLSNPDTYAAELAIIKGGSSPNEDALEVKANNREYYSKGVQSVLGFRFGGQVESDIELGIRVHQDQIDRFQWVDYYAMSNGVMELTASGTPGTESNRVETANAFAAYLQYTLKAGNWILVSRSALRKYRNSPSRFWQGGSPTNRS